MCPDRRNLGTHHRRPVTPHVTPDLVSRWRVRLPRRPLANTKCRIEVTGGCLQCGSAGITAVPVAGNVQPHPLCCNRAKVVAVHFSQLRATTTMRAPVQWNVWSRGEPDSAPDDLCAGGQKVRQRRCFCDDLSSSLPSSVSTAAPARHPGVVLLVQRARKSAGRIVAPALQHRQLSASAERFMRRVFLRRPLRKHRVNAREAAHLLGQRQHDVDRRRRHVDEATDLLHYRE